MCTLSILYFVRSSWSHAGTEDVGVTSYLTNVRLLIVIRAVRLSGRRFGAITEYSFRSIVRTFLVSISYFVVRVFLSLLMYIGTCGGVICGGVAVGAGTKVGSGREC